ncbi:glycoside hydrolase family 43 protein [Microbacterium radiodurans]|uniref:Glycoside hydrolase family 43 protein n=1 Tax=Microbacterium radiodurans TaxID=661398 RepID=A0A5J5IX12_9MICO|nr:glycoside hydrolase family 43 protein [Microbacterium radiodurans]KAA9089681.1 glycoside hydrolase family 43 protein [Microbacterium radiodurans]
MATITQSPPADDPIVEPALESAAREPVVAGFHPDPSICRVGDDYYLVHSSFEYQPGLPIWHSTDLVSWTQIGNALDHAALAGASNASGGIYAPTIRHRDGTFWIITTDIAAGDGQLVVSATDPRGPWSAPWRVEGAVGIDPDLAWDEEGCIVTYCSGDPELRGIAQVRVDLPSGRLLERPRAVWPGAGLAFPEAPHLYRRGSWWYLMLAEGGTERGHAVTIARSRHPEGPFEAHPHNPVFSHRSSTHPVQNVGHADLVERPDGSWAAVYLGVRPRGTTPMFHVNGRETFLAGIDWEDGWPVFVEDRFSVPAPDRSFVEIFAAPLSPRWVSPGAPVSAQLTPLADGRGARVTPVQTGSRATTAVVTRVTDLRWRFDVDLDRIDGSAGILLRLDDAHLAEVRVEAAAGGPMASCTVRIGPLEQRLGDAVHLSDGDAVTVVIESVDPTTGGPDDIVLGVIQSGRRHDFARIDGRYFSTEVAGGFTGRVVGFRSRAGSFSITSATYTAHRIEAG